MGKNQINSQVSFTLRYFLYGWFSLSVSGLVLLLITKFLFLMDFPPLKRLAQIDSFFHYYIKNIDSNMQFFSTKKPVIFIDFDEESVEHEKGYKIGGQTPRGLQASLLLKLKEAGAAVVLLDINYTEKSDEDDKLRYALRRKGCPVIITHSVYSRPNSPCVPKNEFKYSIPPTRAPSVFDDLIDYINIHSAQSELVYEFDFVKGICSCKKVNTDTGEMILPFASILAVDLANGGDGSRIFAKMKTPKVDFFYFRVKDPNSPFSDISGLNYKRLSATNILTNNSDMTGFKNAIVVVGATHFGSDDIHATYNGPMPGALVLVNAILQEQSGKIATHDTLSGLIADLLFLFLQPLVLGLICFFMDNFKRWVSSFSFNLLLGILLLIIQIMQIIFLISVPVILTVILYKYCLSDYFRVNNFSVLLTFTLSIIEVAFEFKKSLSDKISLRVVNWLGLRI